MWYSTPSKSGNTLDIIAWGKPDQILYISPAYNTVILRTGKSDGGVDDRMGILQSIAEKI